MQVDMQVTRGLLDNVASSAAGLQATVDDTSAKIAQMALLSGITGRLLNWLYLVVVVIVLCLFNPNIARLVAAVGCKSLYRTIRGLVAKFVARFSRVNCLESRPRLLQPNLDRPSLLTNCRSTRPSCKRLRPPNTAQYSTGRSNIRALCLRLP